MVEREPWAAWDAEGDKRNPFNHRASRVVSSARVAGGLDYDSSQGPGALYGTAGWQGKNNKNYGLRGA